MRSFPKVNPGKTDHNLYKKKALLFITLIVRVWNRIFELSILLKFFTVMPAAWGLFSINDTVSTVGTREAREMALKVMLFMCAPKILITPHICFVCFMVHKSFFSAYLTYLSHTNSHSFIQLILKLCCSMPGLGLSTECKVMWSHKSGGSSNLK